jgi:predicted ArsR family transcriptional regulator
MTHAVNKGRLNRRKILNFLNEKSENYTIRELGDILDIPPQSVRVHCDHLLFLGLIVEERLYLPKRHKKGIIAYRAVRQTT